MLCDFAWSLAHTPIRAQSHRGWPSPLQAPKGGFQLAYENVGDLVTVPVSVPRHRVSDLYRMVADWTTASGPAVPAEATPTGASTDWRSDDEQLAYQVVRAGNRNARAIYTVLAKKAGKPVSYTDLDAACGMDGPHRVGLLGSMGRTCWTRNRNIPWTWDKENHTYTMPARLATIFLNALSRV